MKIDAAYKAGLSATGILHELFVNIESMLPAEYKNGGKELSINYSFAESPFGKLIVSSTIKGICYMAFEEDKEKAIQNFKSRFPNAFIQEKSDLLQQNALSVFNPGMEKPNTIQLHLKGTYFQLKVWESLLKIPKGKLSTYGNLAKQIGNAKAARAVGTAIGSNPVAYIIPCHRVIQSSGAMGGYMWGANRKAAIIDWEAASINKLQFHSAST